MSQHGSRGRLVIDDQYIHADSPLLVAKVRTGSSLHHADRTSPTL